MIKQPNTLRILLVEDSEHDLLAFRRAFQKSDLPHEIVHFVRAEDALERLKTDAASFDVVVSDYKLSDMSGLELFRELRRCNIPLPFVILTGHGSERLAVEALKAGVDDYLVKGPDEGYSDLLPVVLPTVVRQHEDRLARRRAEEELKKAHLLQERTLRFTEALLSAIPTAVFYKDKEGRYLGCNRAFSEMMGVTSEEMKGKTVYELWPSEQAEVYHSKDLELMKNPSRQVYEFKVRDKNGVDHPVIYAKDVFHDENDQVAGIVGAFMDITDRKQAEEAREKLVDDLRKALDKVKQLSGLLPICASCKKIRDDKGYWNQIESYVHEHSEAEFSHGLCPECAKKLYPDHFKEKEK